MALSLAVGVDHKTPSTPDVLLPLFSVTRFTAKALPLNEWVSSRCKAFTLFQRPSRVAFTIRACSLLTWRSCWGQQIWSQCFASSEDAHIDVSTFICISSLEGSTSFLITFDHAGSQPTCVARYVATSIRSVTERPLLPPAFLCPSFLQRTLRCACLLRRNTGFTMFRLCGIG